MNTTLLAARHVTRHATSPAEAREFLDMLGLTDDAGRLVNEVETVRSKTMPLEHAGPRVRPSHTEFEDRRPAVSTAPEALRNLPPVTELPKPRKLSGSQLIGPPQDRNLALIAPCGTKAARRRHSRNNEQCATCEAMKRRRQVGVDGNGQRPTCGTLAGYKQHYKNHEKRCTACNDAYNADRRQKRARKNPTQHRDTCGTPRGYDSHRRHGEKACEPCRLAENARSVQRRRAAA